MRSVHRRVCGCLSVLFGVASSLTLASCDPTRAVYLTPVKQGDQVIALAVDVIYPGRDGTMNVRVVGSGEIFAGEEGNTDQVCFGFENQGDASTRHVLAAGGVFSTSIHVRAELRGESCGSPGAVVADAIYPGHSDSPESGAGGQAGSPGGGTP